MRTVIVTGARGGIGGDCDVTDPDAVSGVVERVAVAL